MFESTAAGASWGDPGALSDQALCEELSQHAVLVRRAQAHQLLLACEWADRNPRLDACPTAAAPVRRQLEGYLRDLSQVTLLTPGPDPEITGSTAVPTGGAGTPAVSVFSLAELAALQQLSLGTAERLLADALDLRHRLPTLWRHTVAGHVPVHQARRTAQSSRHLDRSGAATVDRLLAGPARTLTAGRYQRLLEATIAEVDPAGTRERVEQARAHQDVRRWRAEGDLNTTLQVTGSHGDLARFTAAVDRLADCLRLEGCTLPAGPRRAKAVGVLANPAHALHLLLTHHGSGHDTGSAEVGGLEPVESSAANPPSGLEPDPALLTELVGATQQQLARLQPALQLVVHVSDQTLSERRGLIRIEGSDRPHTLDELCDQLRHTGTRVTVTAVIDPAHEAATDCYEISHRQRRAVLTRHPTSVFPWSASLTGLDLDHTVPYRRGPDGVPPPGQTAPDGLAPLSRREHRAKTLGGWRVRQPEPGLLLWRSPHGHHWLVTNQGTVALGASATARRIWAAGASPGDRTAGTVTREAA